MRWDRLFDDLEAQVDAAAADELSGEVADRTRRELAVVTVEDRLRAGLGRQVRLRLAGAHQVSGTIREVGAGWMWLDTATGQELVVIPAIHEAGGLGTAVAAPLREVDTRIGITHVLRALAQDRRPAAIGLTDGRVVRGVVLRIGRDFIELDDPDLRVDRPPSPRAIALSALAVLRPGS